MTGGLGESECDGRSLNKPWLTPSGPKKRAVCVKDGGTVKIVRFGDKQLEIKRDDPDRRANFRARHNCDSPGPKTKARYWSCRYWEKSKSASQLDRGEDVSLYGRIVESGDSHKPMSNRTGLGTAPQAGPKLSRRRLVSVRRDQ